MLVETIASISLMKMAFLSSLFFLIWWPLTHLCDIWFLPHSWCYYRLSTARFCICAIKLIGIFFVLTGLVFMWASKISSNKLKLPSVVKFRKIMALIKCHSLSWPFLTVIIVSVPKNSHKPWCWRHHEARFMLCSLPRYSGLPKMFNNIFSWH